MTENQKNSEEGWVMLNAKVPPHIGTLFNILARQRGMTSYEMLQLLINGFITAAVAYRLAEVGRGILKGFQLCKSDGNG